MGLFELYAGLAAFLGGTLIPVMYFRNSGIDLELRVNKIFREKKQIIRQSYLEVAEKICERFKTQRTLSDELEEELEKISDISSRLDDLPIDLSKVVKRITFSFVYGVATVIFIIIFANLPTMNLNSILFPWLQMIVFLFMMLSFIRYVQDGILKIYSLREIEELVNAIDRSDTFKKLYKLTQ